MAVDPVTLSILAAPTIIKGLDLLFDISGEQEAEEKSLEQQRVENERAEQQRRFGRLVSLTQLGSNVLTTQKGEARLTALRNSGTFGSL